MWRIVLLVRQSIFEGRLLVWTLQALNKCSRLGHSCDRCCELPSLRTGVPFQVKRRFYYLDADNFNDKQLLAKLSPPDPAGDTNVPSH